MIDKHFEDYILVCDICGEEEVESYDNFQDAVDAKKELDWKSQKTNRGWEDVCLNCK